MPHNHRMKPDRSRHRDLAGAASITQWWRTLDQKKWRNEGGNGSFDGCSERLAQEKRKPEQVCSSARCLLLCYSVMVGDVTCV